MTLLLVSLSRRRAFCAVFVRINPPEMKHLRKEGLSNREIPKRLEVNRTSVIRLPTPQSAPRLSGQGLDLRFVLRLGALDQA